jgi:hypothetical protein
MTNAVWMETVIWSNPCRARRFHRNTISVAGRIFSVVVLGRVDAVRHNERLSAA